MPKKLLVLTLTLSFIAAGCGFYNSIYKKVDKDIPIEDRDALREKYEGEEAWTRAILVDSREDRIIDRDTKVEVVSLDLHWSGGVMVQGPDNRMLRQSLDLERPLTVDAVEEALNMLFWFDDPEYRYRMNLRKYKSKKTARAIRDHEIFKGMKREAALESWGHPDEIKESKITSMEQWIYRDPRRKGQKRYIYVSMETELVERWEE